MKQKRLSIAIALSILWITFAIRLFSLFVMELGDTTEARYAGMGMRMAIENKFLIPEIAKDIPFLGKPPLAFWATGLSFKIFGINEFTARFPHFLAAIFLLIFVFFVFRRFINSSFAIITTTILGTLPIFITISGYVMTESILILLTSIATISAWIRLEKNGKTKWCYVFFTSMGLIMLTKGPVGIVMILAPLAIYLTISGKWKFFMNTFKIFSGSILSLAIFLPWYIIAEIKNPGFLNYFIIGEHLKRFLVENWSGDAYGNVHSEKIGMIWIFFATGTFPWIINFSYHILKNIRQRSLLQNIGNDFWFFLPFFLFPLTLFTFTNSIIFAYISFSILPFTILTAKLIYESKMNRLLFYISSSVTAIFMTIFLYLYTKNTIVWKISDKPLLEYAYKQKANKIFYLTKRHLNFSSMLYSMDGKIVDIVTISENPSDYSRAVKMLKDKSLIVIDDHDLARVADNKLEKKACNRSKKRCIYEYSKK